MPQNRSATRRNPVLPPSKGVFELCWCTDVSFPWGHTLADHGVQQLAGQAWGFDPDEEEL